MKKQTTLLQEYLTITGHIKQIAFVFFGCVGLFVFVGVQVASAQVTVSGTLYEDDGVTAITTGKTIVAAVGTSTPSLHTATSDGSGNFSINTIATSTGGIAWATSTAAGGDDSWAGVTYGNGLFVAVSYLGDDRVMTSPDGVTWATSTATGDDDGWEGIAYGNGLFVAVGASGDRVMTSPDGITWTARTATGDDDILLDVTYGNGLFVAVGVSGDRVVTSPDGITWTARTAAGDDDGWQSITYGNGLFVAVGTTGDRVMTSPDGITWTAHSAAGDNDSWLDIAYGNGLFVAVGTTGDRVMTSPDGATWATTTAAGGNDGWQSVTYGNGLFVAVGVSGDRVITSPDGITWTARTAAGDDDSWVGITYGNGLFVAVGTIGDRVMTASAGFGEQTPITVYVDGDVVDATTLTYGVNQGVDTIAGVNLLADTVLLQHSTSSGGIDLADADFYDSSQDADILFESVAGTTTISADLIVASNTILYAPQHLVIGGNFVQEGMFVAERGEVIADGSASSILQYFSGVNVFYDFVIENTATITVKNGLTVSGQYTNDGELDNTYYGAFVTLTGNDSIAGSGNLGVVDITGTYISDTADLEFTDLTISTGGDYTAPAGTLTIDGDFVQNGSFDNNGGMVSFAGGGGFALDQMVYEDTLDVSTLRGVDFSLDGTNFYALRSSDLEQYELSTPWDISTAVYLQSTSSDISGKDAISFSADGLAVYAIENGADSISKYTLGTPWDISTLAYQASTTTDGQLDVNLKISPDESILFVTEDDLVTQYSFGIPGDLSSLYFVATSSAAQNLLGVAHDGSSFIAQLTNGTAGRVTSYQMSTPWNLSTAESLGTTVPFARHSFGQYADTPYQVMISPDNRYFYQVVPGRINQFSSFATVSGNLTGTSALGDVTFSGGNTDIASEASTSDFTIMSGATTLFPTTTLTVAGSFQNDGSLTNVSTDGELVLTGSGETAGGNLIAENSLPKVRVEGSYTLSDNASTSALTIASGASLTAPAGMLSIAGGYSNDGTFVHNSGSVVSAIPGYRIPDNLVPIQELDVATQDTQVDGIALSPDGTFMLVGGNNTDAVYSYQLSVPFDVSTAVSADSLDVSTYTTDVQDVYLKPDGTVFWVFSGSELIEYDLTTPFDLGSAVYQQATSPGGGNNRGVDISLDGKYMYVVSLSGRGSIIQYELLTPWDMSTLTGAIASVKDVYISSPEAIKVSADGTQIFIAGSGDIFQYPLRTPYDIFTLDYRFVSAGLDHESFVFSADGSRLIGSNDAADTLEVYTITDGVTYSNTLNGSSAFYDLTVTDEVLAGTSSQSIYFASPVTSAGTFTMLPGTSALFAVGYSAGVEKHTFNNVEWDGGSSVSEVSLRSDDDGFNWYLDISGTQNIDYVNVKDSQAASVVGGVIAQNSTNAGNNTNWFFGAQAAILDSWNSNDWTFYDTITIDNTVIDDDLTDFPVYVDLADLSTQFWDNVQDGGGDIRVTTDANVEVPREVVSASTTFQTGELHFKAATISSTTDTVFKVWYNGSANEYATDATYGAEGVWSNGYIAVYHMEKDGSVTDYLDSTANDNTGTPDSIDGADQTNAVLGNGVNFDGSPEGVTMVDASSFDLADSITISGWAQTDTLAADGTVAAKGASTNDTALMWFDSVVDDFTCALTIDGTFRNGSSGGTYTVRDTGRWYYTTCTYDGAEMNMYVDAVANYTIAVSGGLLNTSRIPTFGRDSTARYLDGRLDEIRFASTSRSAAWVSAEYQNQSTTTDFYNTSGDIVFRNMILSDHDNSQVENAFDSGDVTNEPLYAFKLTSGTVATTTEISFDLTGLKKIDIADFTNLRLYKDTDNDALYDVTDEQVGGAGVITLQGEQRAVLAFSTDFQATTSDNYLVVADWSAPSAGSLMRVDLRTKNISVSDAVGVIVVQGSAVGIQHNRNTSSGGGRSVAIGDAAPAGREVVIGGEESGGDEVGKEEDGLNIAFDSNYLEPSSTGDPYNTWTNPENAFKSDGVSTGIDNEGEIQSYGGFGLSVPNTNQIVGIEVKLDGLFDGSPKDMAVELSWDGGVSTVKKTFLGTGCCVDEIVTLGSATDLWGRVWSPAEFSNANFRLQIYGEGSTQDITVDGVMLRVYHQASGGSAGGGGSGGAI